MVLVCAQRPRSPTSTSRTQGTPPLSGCRSWREQPLVNPASSLGGADGAVFHVERVGHAALAGPGLEVEIASLGDAVHGHAVGPAGTDGTLPRVLAAGAVNIR